MTTLVRNVGVTMRDGATLAADVYLPDDGRPAPAVVGYIPYLKDLGSGPALHRYLEYFARSGYAAVLADFRGTGASEGAKPDAFDAQESEDVHDLVEGVAAADWCDGNVGVWGISYGGITALRAGAARPPHLRALVAIEGSTDPYRYEVVRYGIPGLAMICGEWATRMLCMNALPPIAGTPGGNEEEVWEQHLDALTPWHHAWLDHPHEDGYWKGRSVDPSTIVVPTFVISSWRDTNTVGALRDFDALRTPRRLIVGPWQHGLPDEDATDPIHSVDEMVQWWDRWLRGIESAVDEEPEVAVYVMGSGGWEGYPAWPPPTHDLMLFLSPGGALGETAPGVRRPAQVTFDATVGVHGGLGMAHAPGDQQQDDVRSLVFESRALPDGLDIAGTPRLTLAFETVADEIDVAVRLVDVAPDGGSALVTKGLVRLASPPPAGDVELELNPIRHQVAAGHRLRLALAATDFPEIWPVRSPGDYDVLRGVLTLPVLVAAAPGPTPTFSAPDASLRSERANAGDAFHDVTRDEHGGASVDTGSDTTYTNLDGDRIRVSHAFSVTTSARSPELTELRSQTMFDVEQADRRIRARAESSTTPDAAQSTVRVEVDGRTVVERTFPWGDAAK